MLRILPFLCLFFLSFSKLSLEEKVGQLLMVHFHGEVANEDARLLIQDLKVGGVIYYNWSNGLHSPTQIQVLSEGLQKLAKENLIPIPLLIAADQEGGVVSRLNKGFASFPGNRAIAESGDPQFAQKSALAMGQQLRSVGINMNLAPVVDVNSHPHNPIIGIRSFSDDPEIVVSFGQKALKGYRDAQIIATLKHFPGYGDVTVDPHNDLPIIHKTREQLECTELLPFKKLASSAEAIMTAHILVPALDTENCSTLSEKTLTYLRKSLGFQGVIIADSLVMEGVIKKCCSVDEAAIQALNSGCDILILGGKLLTGEQRGFELTVPDIQRIHRVIINAVKTGRISEKRLDQAVENILNLKKRYIVNRDHKELITQSHEKEDILDHSELAQEIASRALKIIKQKEGFSPSFSEKRVALFAPQLLKDNVDQTALLKIGKTTDSFFFNDLNPSYREIYSAKQSAKKADILFICAYNAWKNPSQITLIQSLIDIGKPVVLLILRDPLDASLFPKADLVFKTFSPSVPSIQAVCDRLESEFLFKNPPHLSRAHHTFWQ